MAAKCKENPRYHVLSVRVSDEERETLEQISMKANKSVSDLLREVFAVMATATTR
jgi:predicted DNA-binding protein